MSDMPTSFIMTLALALHVGGGTAVGVALRRIHQERSNLPNLFRAGFLLVWGALFGGLPLLWGLTTLPRWFLWVQLAVFLGTIALVALRYEWLRELYGQPGMAEASIGFAGLLVGGGLTASVLSSGSLSGVLAGLIVCGLGGALTLDGVRKLLRGQ